MRRQRVELTEVAGLLPLIKAAHRSAKASRERAQTQVFMSALELRCGELSDLLLSGRYTPGPFRSFMVRDPKPRWISAAPFVDRIVHHSLCASLEPRFERYAYDHSYACRQGRGTHLAIQRVQAMTQRGSYALKLDIKHYFETISHQRLKTMIRGLIKGEETLRLCEQLIDHSPARHQVGFGLPIGNLTSQHFANLYLGQLDHYISDLKGGGSLKREILYARYMDDLVLIGRERADLVYMEEAIREYTQSLELEMKESARRFMPISEGVPFLGCRIWPSLIRLDGARRRRLHRKLKALYRADLSQEERQARLTSVLAWVDHCGGRSLMYNWHQRRSLCL